MNAQITVLPEAATADSGNAYASVTIWSNGTYFLQVHYGYFNTWEDAEDFPGISPLRLERRSNALFLCGPHGEAFIADQALQIYRAFDNVGQSTFEMTLDDLFEVADVEDMMLTCIGTQAVVRDRPIVARAMTGLEFQAANDAR